jgi:DNA-directed RNA polymerase subunit RPC12/RpoP
MGFNTYVCICCGAKMTEKEYLSNVGKCPECKSKDSEYRLEE